MKEEIRAYFHEQTEKAFKNWESDKPNKALRDIEKAIQFLPNISFLLVMKALFYCSAKKVIESNKVINSLNKTQISKPELNLVQYILSCNYIHEKRFYEAIWYADEIIRRDKNAYYAYFPKAISQQELNEHTIAIKNFKKALKEKTQINEIKACLAFSYLKKRRFIKALILHLKVKNYFKDNFKINHHIGMNYFMINFHKKALKYISINQLK